MLQDFVSHASAIWSPIELSPAAVGPTLYIG